MATTKSARTSYLLRLRELSV